MALFETMFRLVDEGKVRVSDPEQVQTVEEFIAALQRLRVDSGLTYRQLERRAHLHGEVLPYSTAFHALNRDRLPRPELLQTIVRACGGDAQQTARWQAAWQRVHTVSVEGGNSPPGPSSEPHELPAVTSRSSSFSRIPRWLRLGGLITALAVVAVADSSPSPTLAQLVPTTALYHPCTTVVSLGAYGSCVQWIQERLQSRSMELPVDAGFGPYTRMRLTAFQVAARLPPTGIGDKQTTQALLADGPPQLTWTRPQVKERLRQVFPPAAADRAQKLVWCMSAGDPLWITGPDVNGVRRWGLFQYTDLQLFSLRATPSDALTPEWNIEEAYRLWKRSGSFAHWQCPGSDVLGSPAQIFR
ncbi:peptidoglycan-binding protein [Nonomuraea sp. NPDC050540]|uniref:peptidoglycan-binding protein n=1 Tax=Nonomuraea sp. NPDC050540 TaxID=3364367 RepID=UPI0037B07BEF